MQGGPILKSWLRGARCSRSLNSLNPIGHADDDSDGKPNQASCCKPNHNTYHRTDRDADCKPDNLACCQSHHQPHHVTDGEPDDFADELVANDFDFILTISNFRGKQNKATAASTMPSSPCHV